MNQNYNMYYSSQENFYPSYPPLKPEFNDPYLSQPIAYSSKPTMTDEKQVPPYISPTTVPGCERNQVQFQTPPIIHHVLPTTDQLDSQPSNGWGKFSGLESKQIRHGFIRKVYAILTVQLLVTFGIVTIFTFTPVIRNYIRSPAGRWAYWTSYGVFFVTYIALACCKRAGRRFPLNLILLSILTLAMTFMMGMVSAYFKIESIYIAVGLTSFVCFGVTLFSFQTKFDFTSIMGVMFVVSLALVGFGFVCIFTHSRIMYTVYAGLGTIAFSIFLAVDTQLVMGGKRHEISAEDHVFASIMLYLDIVYIFLYILMLFGKRE